MSFHRSYIIFAWILAALFCLPKIGSGQLSPSLYSYPNNHIPWYTIESSHFRIHFQEGNNRSARQATLIAEEIYPEITRLYDFEPDTKTDIVLKDRQDYSNGAAYFFDNQIDIWVPALDTPLRGTHEWLWDVITHEFTHIVQLQIAMKKNRRIPALYFQWLSYSNVRRPDVLYGYPRGIITYPFASINVPAWLAEGVAQYQRSDLYYDYWDSHRDMLFRTSLLSDEPISFEDMGIFGSKNALQRERIYNQGFAFTSFLAGEYGENILPRISETLAKPGVFSINEALEKATGTSGKKLFQEFISRAKRNYRHAVDSLSPVKTQPVQADGFFNFYPRISPDGDRIAYLSNRKSQAGETELFIEQRTGKPGEQHAIYIGEPNTSDWALKTHREQDPIIKHIRSAFSFSPDGNAIVFCRNKLNSYGEQYDDLFIYHLETGKENRITSGQRLSSPAWHPSKEKITAVQQSQGSTNLVEIDMKTLEITTLTDFKNGEQVYTPVWHPDGKKLYFSYSDNNTRDILTLDRKSGKITAVLKGSHTDYRDPHLDRQANNLYYAADPDGIFNIYRIPLEEENPHPQKMTNVIGGAFMPFVYGRKLNFAEFKADGYKISAVKIPEPAGLLTPGRYRRNFLQGLKMPGGKAARPPHLKKFKNISKSRIQSLGPDDTIDLKLFSPESKEPSILDRHENTFTSFSLYPVVRFDNYTQKNGSNGRLLTAGKFGNLGENILRDMKLGTYFSSREVTGRLNIFGGAMFGFFSEPSSGIDDFFSPARLTDLDRDLFLITEYRGLPFIKKRWSPTVSLELTNLRRNVADGLSIEEFPCTACLPDTTNADIAYAIWEADIFLRSKISNKSLFEIGAGYSPYRVQTDGFYSRELKQFVPSTSSEYFRGTTLTAAYVYENFVSYPHRDVAPLGFRGTLRYTYEPNKLLKKYEIESGTLSPVYDSVKNHSLKASVRMGYPVGRNSSLHFYGRGFRYLNNPDDFFYLDYIGGFTGMRSYPYFAIGGNSTAIAQLSYTFPLVEKIHTQVGRHTPDKLYLRLFAEAGNGWNGPLEIGNNLKTGVGAEVRFAFNSYYLFPLKLFVSGSYGFDKFDVTLPDKFITESAGGNVTYGREMIFHFGLTFDFDVLNHD